MRSAALLPAGCSASTSRPAPQRCGTPLHCPGGLGALPARSPWPQTRQTSSLIPTAPLLRPFRACSPTHTDENQYVYCEKEELREAERRLRRTMFSLEDWKKHRSGSRYSHHVTTLLESGVAQSVFKPVMTVTCLALFVALWCSVFASKPPWLPVWAPPPPSIAIEPIQLTSIALSLLLVFRTNASYARWEEARKKFGTITTTSRDIARQVFSYFPKDDWEGKTATARWLLALSRSAMAHLRGDEHDLRKELKGVLSPRELDWLCASPHRPNTCLQMLTRIISGARIPSELLIRLDENMSKLVEAQSSCERIINTPIPLSYTRHTARFLMAWLACVPFALWSYAGWAMVPICALIAFVLLGIEEIGVYIEEPFSVLPLERLCDRLDRNMSAMMRDHNDIDDFLSRPGNASGGGLCTLPASPVTPKSPIRLSPVPSVTAPQPVSQEAVTMLDMQLTPQPT